ncbi:MAG: metallophosphoesterase [Paracoccaceae bacterium]
MQRTYAIGDVHGYLDKLRQVHELIEADRAADGGQGPVVHIGDLMDRGPDAAGVIEFVISGIAAGRPWIVLKGNHERMMSYFLQAAPHPDAKLRNDLSWLHPRLGGMMTLASYGVQGTIEDYYALHQAARAAVPAAHRAFLSGLDTSFRTDEVVFVHAGIRAGGGREAEVEDDLVWIREPFLSDVRDHGALIVHGHTPVEAVTHYGNRVNIDSGVAFGGPLSAIVIEGRDVWRLTPDGREALLATN